AAPPGRFLPMVRSARPALVRTRRGRRRLTWTARSAGSSARCCVKDAARRRELRSVVVADRGTAVAARGRHLARIVTPQRVPKKPLSNFWRIPQEIVRRAEAGAVTPSRDPAAPPTRDAPPAASSTYAT